MIIYGVHIYIYLYGRVLFVSRPFFVSSFSRPSFFIHCLDVRDVLSTVGITNKTFMSKATAFHLHDSSRFDF